jgi:nitrate reductase gamma subunit
MFEFVRGPLIWISFLIFIAGLLYQTFKFFNLSRKKELIFIDLPFNPEKPKSKGFFQRVGDWLVYLKKETVWRTHPLMMVLTWVFHISLFIIPIFLLGHNILLNEAWGISFCSFPEFISDLLTWIPFICGGIFLFRRIFLRRVRAITTGYDYLTLAITLAPFITGYLAYHQLAEYQTAIFLHILAGEVMFITIPFTKLGHMLFFFFYRFFIGSEYSFGRGSRTW